MRVEEDVDDLLQVGWIDVEGIRCRPAIQVCLDEELPRLIDVALRHPTAVARDACVVALVVVSAVSLAADIAPVPVTLVASALADGAASCPQRSIGPIRVCPLSEKQREAGNDKKDGDQRPDDEPRPSIHGTDRRYDNKAAVADLGQPSTDGRKASCAAARRYRRQDQVHAHGREVVVT
ncbi:hypothetical protein [Micromonospora sp. NPDC049374]|uniref:hypothetical protein n=1 Tax=Micromonospora sp. NPDC049374 TaxID=3154352 RepID=UPI003418F817